MDTKNLLEAKRQAAIFITEDIQALCESAVEITGESEMTADYIWGNCTLDELMEYLEKRKEMNLKDR